MSIKYILSNPQHRRGILYLFGACLIWAGWWVIIRQGIAGNGINPFDLAAIRYAVAGICLLPVLTHMGLGTSWMRAALLGLCGGLLNSLTAFYGIQYAPASHGAALMPAMAPIFTALIAWLALNESIGRMRWIGICVSIAGALTIGSGYLASADENQWIGHLMFLASSICWSLYIVLMRLWRINAWQGTAIAAVTAMIVYLPVYSFIVGGRVFDYPISTLLFHGFYQGILNSVAAFALFNFAIGIFGASAAAASSVMIPVFTVILAALFIGEIPTFIELIGILAVIAGLPFAMGLIGQRDAAIHDDIADKSLGTRVDTRA